jgi:hypothetical protein
MVGVIDLSSPDPFGDPLQHVHLVKLHPSAYPQKF